MYYGFPYYISFAPIFNNTELKRNKSAYASFRFFGIKN